MDVQRVLYWLALLVMVVLVVILGLRVLEAALTRLGAATVLESDDG